MAAPETNWFENSAFSHDIQPEADGSDFLHDYVIADSYFGHKKVQRQVNNVIGWHGATKPKKNTPAAREMKIKEWTEMITFASALTKNSDEVCALPVDVATIRGYKLEQKDFKLPPYQVDDNSTLLKPLVDMVENNYAKYCAVDEKDFKAKNPGGDYLPKTEFSKLKPLLGDVCRFCIKYWHLHPWLSRAEAYKDAIAHFRTNYSSKRTLKILIDELLQQRTDVILKTQLFALETVHKEGSTSGELVFAENDEAQPFILRFLKHENWKMKKDSLDPLLDLQECIESFTDEEEKKEWKAKFEKLVPKETATYLEKKQKAEEKAQKLERAKAVAEAKEAEKLEKKRKALEENQAAAAAAAAAAGLADSATRTAATLPDAEDDDGVVDLDMAARDPFWEYKLTIKSGEIVSQVSAAVSGTGRAAKIAKKQHALLPETGIKKTIMSFSGRSGCTVQYTEPGQQWYMGFTARYGNLVNAINSFGTANLNGRDIVESCVEKKDNTTITKGCGRVILAVFLHNSVKNDKDLPKLGLHANFNETNFLIDLKNTKKCWLPALLAGSSLAIHGLYELVCSDEKHARKDKNQRVELLLEHIGQKDVMTTEKAKQVLEIILLLQAIIEEIASGTLGEKEMPVDPFDTESNLGMGK